jgi:hypothetical protein
LFDLYILPYHIKSGQEQSELPGLFVCQPPRKADRHRSSEQLILILNLSGGSLPDAAEWETLFQQVARSFYQSSGSTTAAMRAAALELHNYLLERNVRLQKADGSTVGLLNLAVMRGETMLLLHAGPTHTYLLGRDQVVILHEEAQLSGPGLGFSRSINFKFYPVQLEAGSLVLFCTDVPAKLTPAALAHKDQLSLESLRRRLFNLSASNMQAVIIQARPGRGVIHRLKVRATLAAAASASEAAAPPAPAAESAVEPISSLPASPDAVETSPPIVEASPQVGMPAIAPAAATAATVSSVAQTANRQAAARQAAPVPPTTRAAPAAEEWTTAETTPGFFKTQKARLQNLPWKQKLAPVFMKVRDAGQRLDQVVRTAVQRMLPGTALEMSHNQARLMLIIAILIPLAVAAIATSVYLNSGHDVKRRDSLQLAQRYIDAAVQQKDPVMMRSAYIAALKQVETAEQSGRNDQTYALRRKAQDALDTMDGINRLYLTPLLPEGFSVATRITGIVATNTDIYLLDGARNRILRLAASGQGYAIDNQFSCGALNSRSGNLVDIMALPSGNKNNASILTVDESGYQTYCIPNNQQLTNQLIPDDRGWGRVMAASLRQNTIFVLDNQIQDILRYYDTTYNFGGQPRSFFSNQTLDLKDVVDMSISDDDLYLLRSNGQMVICSATSYNTLQVRCTDPAPYGDMRANRERQPLSFPDANFTRMEIVSPPDPSLFLLDSRLPSIYHLSLRYLNLQRILQPSPAGNFELPSSAITAFTVTPNRMVLVAYSNKLYYAALP